MTDDEHDDTDAEPAPKPRADWSVFGRFLAEVTATRRGVAFGEPVEPRTCERDGCSWLHRQGEPGPTCSRCGRPAP